MHNIIGSAAAAISGSGQFSAIGIGQHSGLNQDTQEGKLPR